MRWLQLLQDAGTMGCMGVVIRRAETDDWSACRDIRLRALRDEPQAYESTFEDEQHLSDQRWRDRIARASTFLAVDRAKLVGMAVALVQDDGDLMIVAMYVAPEVRGRGIAARLIDEIAKLALTQGACRLVLDLADGNAAAERSYRRYGFVPTGERTPMRRDPSIFETRLAYVLPSASGDVTGPN
jgi:GNAT superfamily N-acetyltransferase